MVEVEEDTILYYYRAYWKVIRVGYSGDKKEFYECWCWSYTNHKWNTIHAYLIPANGPHKVRIPGKLEVLINLGAKEVNGQY